MRELVRSAAIVIAVTAIAVVALVATHGFGSVGAAKDDGAIRSAVKTAISDDLGAYVLPPGFVPGRASDSARRAVRDQMTQRIDKHFTRGLRARLLNSELPWADEISTGYDQVFDLTVRVEDFTLFSLVTDGSAATVTGGYVVYIKHAQAMDDQGHLVTWGGRSTSSFTATVVSEDGQWKVSDLTATQTAFEDDPSAHSGGQYLPTAEPKPTGPIAPIPVLP